jgi:hypothetical protein
MLCLRCQSELLNSSFLAAAPLGIAVQDSERTQRIIIEIDNAMSDKARFEQHFLNLGKLTGNLQTIEMGARLAIVRFDDAASQCVQAQLPKIKVGEEIKLNAFTNKDDLNQTLEKYNKRAPLDCRIDKRPIVALREALAHGRTFGFDSMKNLRLLKFSRKTNHNKVVVELAVDMTEEWFQNNIRILNNAIGKITKALDYEIREFT